MNTCKRPDDFEERAEAAGAKSQAEDIEEAFLSGALWAALLFEGRLPEDEDDDD